MTRTLLGFFLHTFRMQSFGPTFFLFSPLISNFNISVFFFFAVLHSISRSPKPSCTDSSVSFVALSVCVATIAVGDAVLLREYVRFRVRKLFLSDGTVVLQKIPTRGRPCKRFINQLWVPPASTHDAVAYVEMPLQIACARSLSPLFFWPTPAIPPFTSSHFQVFGRLLLLDDQLFSTVNCLEQAFEETRSGAGKKLWVELSALLWLGEISREGRGWHQRFVIATFATPWWQREALGNFGWAESDT